MEDGGSQDASSTDNHDVGQVFTQKAVYNGTVVAIKKIKKFSVQMTPELIKELNEVNC